MSIQYYDWNDFDRAMQSGANKLRTFDRIKYGTCPGIYGIPRSGLVIAVALSHHLSLKVLNEPRPWCIIVDDMIASGYGFKQAANRISWNVTAMWAWFAQSPQYAKLNGEVFVPLAGKAVYFREMIAQTDDVVCPWEYEKLRFLTSGER